MVRQWQLLMELQKNPTGRHYLDLARSLRVKPTTIYRDLRTLKRAGFPIAKTRIVGRDVWKLEGSVAPPVLLTPLEIQALALGGQMMCANYGAPLAGAMEQALRKISGGCDREGRKTLEVANARFHAVARRARPYERYEVWFNRILSALNRSRTVRIRYFTLHRGEETAREVDPYGIVLHEGAFYLIGFCHLRKAIRTFLMDRIRQVEILGDIFKPPEGFSAKKHLEHAWGIITEHMLVTVRVKFGRDVASIIKEGRWHPSQKLEENKDGSVTATYHVSGLTEIMRWILAWGSSAVVLEPEGLRKAIGKSARAMCRAYREVMSSSDV